MYGTRKFEHCNSQAISGQLCIHMHQAYQKLFEKYVFMTSNEKQLVCGSQEINLKIVWQEEKYIGQVFWPTDYCLCRYCCLMFYGILSRLLSCCMWEFHV